MPFINIETNAEITTEKADILKSKCGKAITLLPGKNENGLMLSFEGGKTMFKAGKADLSAFIEVRIYGNSTKDAYDALTVELTKIMNDEFEITAGNVYINYMEFPMWGVNGGNI